MEVERGTEMAGGTWRSSTVAPRYFATKEAEGAGSWPTGTDCGPEMGAVTEGVAFDMIAGVFEVEHLLDG